jgi:hypothetical protein
VKSTVSLLSINRTTIFLSPTGAFSLVRSHLDSGQIRSAAHREPGLPPAVGADPDLAGLRALVESQGGGAIEIVLSNHLVRYQLFPWQENLQNLKEELGFARFSFTQTYGAAVENWHIALSDEAPGKPRIAAAIDAGLLDRLGEAVKGAGGELVSVATSLVSALNFWRAEFENKQPTWFLTYESGLLTVVLRDRKGWRWVRSRRVGDDWLAGWRQIIADETLMFGEDAGAARALLFAPGCKLPPQQATGALALQPLKLDDQLERFALKDNRYAFAWVA